MVKRLPSRVTDARPKTFPGAGSHGRRFNEIRVDHASAMARQGFASAAAAPEQDVSEDEGEEGEERGVEGAEAGAAAAGRTQPGKQMSRIHWALLRRAEASSEEELAAMTEEQRAKVDFCKLTLAYKETRVSWLQYDPEMLHFENFVLEVCA